MTFRSATNELLSPILFKSLLDYNATMAADGFVVKKPVNGGVDMIISGLSPGKHSVVTCTIMKSVTKPRRHSMFRLAEQRRG